MGVKYGKLNIRLCLDFKGNDDKPALFDDTGKSLSYKDFKRAYDSFRELAVREGIKDFMRIAVVTGHPLSMQLVSIPVMDMAVLCPVSTETDGETLAKRLGLLKVDYLLYERGMTHAVDAADGLGIGMAEFEPFELTGNPSLSFNVLRSVAEKSLDKGNKDSHQVMINTTSGTTSTPKVVPILDGQYLEGQKMRIRAYDYTSDDRFLIITKPYKSQTINRVMLTLSLGGTAVIMNGFNHARFLELIDEFSITVTTVTPAVLISLAGYMKDTDIRISSKTLRFIRASGAPLNEQTRLELEDMLGTRIVHTYGMTETKNISSTYREPAGHKPGSVGVTSGLEARVRENEIQVRGASVFEGYENEDIDNADYFMDGWFRTGDIGRIDGDGYIFITGRIKEMINRGGEKISPYEVEEAIMRHPGIADAAVFPYPDENGYENVGASIVVNDSVKTDLNELRRYLSGTLPSFKIPTLLYCTDSIPTGDNNKVQRKKLFEVLNERYPEVIREQNERKSDGSQMTGTQKLVISAWKKILKRRNIGIDDVFIENGGDSLSGAAILSFIEKATGVSVPVNVLFDNGTVRSIAEYIDNAGSLGKETRFIKPVKPSGHLKPLYCMHSGFGDSTTYRFIGEAMNPDRPVYALTFDRKFKGWPFPLTFDSLAETYSKELMELDPEGPYHLCGHCWGGVLAYHVACKLTEKGGTVSFLGMMDSSSGGFSDKSKREKPLGKILFVARDGIDQLKNYKGRKRLKMFMRKFKNSFRYIGSFARKKIYAFAVDRNSRFLAALTGTAGALSYAYRKFRPERYPGRLHYFKSTKGSGSNFNYEFWSGMAESSVLYEVDCHHNDIIMGEHARKVTDIIDMIIGGDNG